MRTEGMYHLGFRGCGFLVLDGRQDTAMLRLKRCLASTKEGGVSTCVAPIQLQRRSIQHSKKRQDLLLHRNFSRGNLLHKQAFFQPESLRAVQQQQLQQLKHLWLLGLLTRLLKKVQLRPALQRHQQLRHLKPLKLQRLQVDLVREQLLVELEVQLVSREGCVRM